MESTFNVNFGQELTLDEIDTLTGVYNTKYDETIVNERFGPELTWIEILELVKPPTKNYEGWWNNDRLRQIQRDVEMERFWTIIDGNVFIIRYRHDGRFLVKSLKFAGPCALFYDGVFKTLPEHESGG